MYIRKPTVINKTCLENGLNFKTCYQYGTARVMCMHIPYLLGIIGGCADIVVVTIGSANH